MAVTTRYSVAKTARSYDPAGVNAVLGSVVNSETQDMRDAYHYGTSVGGDVSDGPAPDYAQLSRPPDIYLPLFGGASMALIAR